MIEYKFFETKKKTDILEAELNALAMDGWRVICMVGKNGSLVLGREKEIKNQNQTGSEIEISAELQPTIQPPRII